MTAATRNLADLRAQLARVPDPPAVAPAALEDAITDSLRYLRSDDALRSLDADTYWPKWHSPWWHMLLLFELGEAARIPERVARHMAARLDAMPCKVFPIHPGELPAGADPYRDTSCHCALGSVDQVLAACGLDVDRALPWIGPWYARYQSTARRTLRDLADAGLVTDAA